MLAYAAERRRRFQRRNSPPVMLAILVGHIAVVAVVMSVRMELPAKIKDTPTFVDWIEPDEPPPPDNPTPAKPIQPSTSTIDRPRVIQPTPVPGPPPLDLGPSVEPLGPAVGSGIEPLPMPVPEPKPVPIHRAGPRFATPDDMVRPPYPLSKIDSEEEAILRLKLAIDARGRVIGVTPVGATDPAFLAAARKHLLAHWRYKPATEDGRAIASETVITLRFELD